MAGDVELRDHADAAGGCVGHHFAHLVLRIVIAVRPGLLQLGIELALGAEALVVGKVPVKYVELHGGHGVEIALDHREGQKMARAIEHQSAPGEARLVGDVGRGRLEAPGSGLDQLQKGLQPVQRAGHRGRLEVRARWGDVQLVTLVLAQHRRGGARRAGDAQGRGGARGRGKNAGLKGHARQEALHCGRQAGVGIRRDSEGGVDGKRAGGEVHLGGHGHQGGRGRMGHPGSAEDGEPEHRSKHRL